MGYLITRNSHKKGKHEMWYSTIFCATDEVATSDWHWWSAFRIRIGFSADPAQIQGAKQMRFRLLGRFCRHKKLDFDMKNIFYVVMCHKIYPCRYKGHIEGWKSRLFVNYWSISLLLDTDPHSKSGSGSRRVQSIRIHPKHRVEIIQNFTWHAAEPACRRWWCCPYRNHPIWPPSAHHTPW